MFGWIPYFRNFTCSWDYDDGNYYPDGVSGENAPKPMGNSDNYAFHTAFAPAFSSQFTKEEDLDAAAPYYNKMHAIWRRAAKYTLSGDFKSSGEKVFGAASTADEWQTATFVAEKN